MSKYNVGLKILLLQGFLEPEFVATWYIKKKNGKNDFPYRFKKIIVRKKIGYYIDVLQQIA